MNEYKNLKRKYGENFAKFCRTNFPGILEEEGKLSEILESKFTPSHYLFEDIQEQNQETAFKNFIFTLFYEGSEEQKEDTPKHIPTPEELMDKAGYVLYKCETDEDVKSFKKYYGSGREELCTFRDPTRIDGHYIFFAVKKNVDEIRREDFDDPKRQDKYGTSVLCLQFLKGSINTLSIKNRYNHAVKHCDATFSNDLENIIAGLSEAFEHHYNLTLNPEGNNKFHLENYIQALDGKLYRYNYEINNEYFCSDNVIVRNGMVTEYDKSKFILFDDFLLDLKQKEFINLSESVNADSSPLVPTDITKIDVKDGDKKGDREITISTESGNIIKITVNDKGQMTEYFNKDIEVLPEYSFYFQEYLEKFSAPNLKEIRVECLVNSKNLAELNLDNVERIMYGSFYYANKLKKLYAPNLFYIEHSCFCNCRVLEEIDLPNLECIDSNVFKYTNNLKSLKAPKLSDIGSCCFYRVNTLQEINLPQLQFVSPSSFNTCRSLQTFKAENLERLGINCFREIDNLETLDLPNLKTMGKECFYSANSLKSLNLPNCVEMLESCFMDAENIEEINAPSLETLRGFSFCNCFNLKKVNMPNVAPEYQRNIPKVSTAEITFQKEDDLSQ